MLLLMATYSIAYWFHELCSLEDEQEKLVIEINKNWIFFANAAAGFGPDL